MKKKKTLSFANEIRIVKLKEYDGNNESEKMFFDGLFNGVRFKSANISKAKEIIQAAKEHGETISFVKALELSTDNYGENNCVTTSDLQNSFYKVIDKIKGTIGAKKNKDKIFESIASSKIKWIIIMMIIIYLIITVKPVADYGGMEMLMFALLFPMIAFTVVIASVVSTNKNNTATNIFLVVWGLMFGGVPWSMMVLPVIISEPAYIALYVVGIIAIVILTIFAKIMRKRTKYGNEMLGKLRGFKNFLETAEKSRLESLVYDNPEYFYDILPYTYALGVSDKWISQFETIAISAPTWYDSPNGFTVHSFGSAMNSTMRNASYAMQSRPSSSSGGGSW